MRRLRKGEYDLVSISLIGFDPITGRSFEEWRTAFEELQARISQMKWWHFIEQVRCRWQLLVLAERQGM